MHNVKALRKKASILWCVAMAVTVLTAPIWVPCALAEKIRK